MKMAIVTAATVWLVIVSLFYLFFSIATWQLNPAHWEEGTRIGFAASSGVISFIAAGVTFVSIIDSQKS